jgi:DnaJ-class molecular chaperone
MTTNEPQFLSEIQIKVTCDYCEGRRTETHRSGEEIECWKCDGRGFHVETLEEAILDLVKANIRDMLKDVIGN